MKNTRFIISPLSALCAVIALSSMAASTYAAPPTTPKLPDAKVAKPSIKQSSIANKGEAKKVGHKAKHKEKQINKEQQKELSKIVNINTATPEQIASALKGVGLKKAQAIVAWRKANGAFAQIEQLLEVKGIGEKTLSLNKERIKI